MGTRETSRRTYRAIVANGLLSKARLRVYRYLLENGPCTGSEVNKGLDSPHAHKRLSELLEQGAVEEYGAGACPITGMDALLWSVTDDLPTPLDRTLKQSRAQLEARIVKLEEKVKKARSIWRNDQAEIDRYKRILKAK